MKRTLAILFTAILLVSLAGCATAAPTPAPATAAPTTAATTEAVATTATPTAAPLVLTDFLGSTVTYTTEPQRIISLSPANTEIVYALGLQDKLVGVDAVSDYPEAVKSIAKVGDFNGPNLETIVSLKPDLVLGGNKLQKDVINKIKALGINVVAAEATTYEDVYKSIDLIAGLTGTQQKAAALEADMKTKEKLVLDSVAKETAGKTVYYAMSYGKDGNWTAGPGSFPFELITMCGAKNITEGFPVPWVNLSQEQLISHDPDIILLSSDVGGTDAFMKTSDYASLKAVKAGQVFPVTSNLCSRPSPRIVDGLREFAQAIYGIKIPFPGD